MLTKEQIAALVEEYVSSLPYPAVPERLYAPIAYSLEGGGKRVRPVLLVAAAGLFGCDVQEALPCAAAVEVFHNFTLLHDDIMDRADVRRGRPSVHRKWDENTAILSGDVMMVYAYSLLEKYSPETLALLFPLFNTMAREVCEGQQADMDFETAVSVGIGQYIDMISLKTSALIARPLQMGALIGGASQDDAGALYRFGIELGIAFQLQDDLLDTYGTQDVLGKQIGGDIMEGKKTFLLITAAEKADPAMTGKLLSLLDDKTMEREAKVAAVRDIYNLLGVREAAQEAVGKHTDNALAALKELSPATGDTSTLEGIAAGLLKRRK